MVRRTTVVVVLTSTYGLRAAIWGRRTGRRTAGGRRDIFGFTVGDADGAIGGVAGGGSATAVGGGVWGRGGGGGA